MLAAKALVATPERVPFRLLRGNALSDEKPTRLKSFESIYQEYSGLVYHLAFRLTGRAADAEDLLQETFIRVYRFLPQYRGGSFKAWLNKIVVNLYLTRCRSRAVKSQVSLEEAQTNEALWRTAQEAITDSKWDPAQVLDQVSLDDRVQLALDSLPEEYRVALVLREIQDLTYEEIAELLDVPLGTVRSRLARARTQL
ncbi:MAG: sigma-70 family RNA polymerase sigma factor, partial [Candidatus Eremiobacterota bacterium]